MNTVGIDVSKNKSMVAVARPLGQVVVKPFGVRHAVMELKKLADFLKSLDGETEVGTPWVYLFSTENVPAENFITSAGRV